jgi:hypothetical protein
MTRILTIAAITLLLSLPRPALAQQVQPQSAESPPEEQAQAVFFEGLDLQEQGSFADAAARFELAVQLDPNLHQARLYLAESYYMLGRKDEAVPQIMAYLESDFPTKQIDRSRELLVACGVDELTADEAAAAAAATPPVPDTTTTAVTTTTTSKRGPWTLATIEVGPQVTYHANEIDLVALGPVIAGRFLIQRYIELSFQFQMGFGRYPDHDGVIWVPNLAPGAAVSLPFGYNRLSFGAMIPVVYSRRGDEAGFNAGIAGTVSFRGAIPGSRLVFGGQFEAGHVVRPMIGGSLRVGIQLGPMPDGL